MRGFGIDVRNKILDLLKTSFNTELAVVNTERSISAPQIKTFTSDNVKGQLPAIFVDLGIENITKDRLGNDLNTLRSIGEVIFTIISKNAKKQEDYIEVYIETLLRVVSFKNLDVERFVDIIPVSIERTDLYDKSKNLFYRTAIVTFEYQIN